MAYGQVLKRDQTIRRALRTCVQCNLISPTASLDCSPGAFEYHADDAHDDDTREAHRHAETAASGAGDSLHQSTWDSIEDASIFFPDTSAIAAAFSQGIVVMPSPRRERSAAVDGAADDGGAEGGMDAGGLGGDEEAGGDGSDIVGGWRERRRLEEEGESGRAQGQEGAEEEGGGEEGIGAAELSAASVKQLLSQLRQSKALLMAALAQVALLPISLSGSLLTCT